MPLTKEQQTAVINAARALIGTPYADLDCSHFVHSSYAMGGLSYQYLNTKEFKTLEGKSFVKVDEATDSLQGADVVLFSGHMGLWDPEGCKVIEASGKPNAECKQFKNDLPFLSSRSGGNRGPDFGRMKWFGDVKAVYRWK